MAMVRLRNDKNAFFMQKGVIRDAAALEEAESSPEELIYL